MSRPKTLQNAGVLEAVEDTRVLDPLSEVTRRERKALLLVSLMALAISVGGLVPSEIQALGITLSQAERDSILVLISLSILYLLAGFWIYTLADLRSRDLAIALGRQKISPDLASEMSTVPERFKTIIDSKDFGNFTTDPEIKKFFSVIEELKLVDQIWTAGTFRVAFDYYLPVFVGLVAIAMSLFEARELMSARLIGYATTLVVTIIGTLQVIRKRKRMISSVKNLKSPWYMWRIKRGIKRLKELDPQSPKYDKLGKKLQGLAEKHISGPPLS